LSRISSVVVVSAIVLGGIGAWGTATGASSRPNASPIVTQEPGDPVQYSSTVDTSPPAPSAASDADIVQTELSKRPTGSAVLGAEISRPEGTTATAGQLHLDLSATTLDGGGWIRSFWEGSLLQGAVADELATGLDTSTGVSGGTFVIHLPDGTSKELGAGAGKVRTRQIFSRLDASGHEQASSNITAVLASFGLGSISTTFITYRDDAVAIVAQVPTGGSLHDFDSLRLALTGTPAQYEGVYLEVRDSSGSPIAISATAFRTGAGTLWVDPTVAGTIGELERTIHN